MVKPKNMLRKKLYRDMSRAAMQFLSIIALCALGTFAFSALDGMARMIRTTLNTYYEENNLADYWISLPTADRAALDKVAAVPGVTHVRARTTIDMDTTLSDGEARGAARCGGGLRARLGGSGYDAPRRRFRFRHGLRRRNDHQQAAAARGRAA